MTSPKQKEEKSPPGITIGVIRTSEEAKEVMFGKFRVPTAKAGESKYGLTTMEEYRKWVARKRANTASGSKAGIGRPSSEATGGITGGGKDKSIPEKREKGEANVGHLPEKDGGASEVVSDFRAGGITGGGKDKSMSEKREKGGGSVGHLPEKDGGVSGGQLFQGR